MGAEGGHHSDADKPQREEGGLCCSGVVLPSSGRHKKSLTLWSLVCQQQDEDVLYIHS